MDVKSRRCAAEGCNKYPAFNVPGENTARYCGDHRQAGMIDVHNKRCNSEGCIKRPTFNYPGKDTFLATSAQGQALLHTPSFAILLGQQICCDLQGLRTPYWPPIGILPLA